MFESWGHFVYRRRWLVLVLSFVLMGLSVGVLSAGGTLKSGGIIQTSESGRATKLIADQLPKVGGSSFQLVLSSPTLTVTDPAFKAAFEQAIAPLRTDARVTQILTPYDPVPQAAALASKDGHAAVAAIGLKDESVEAAKYYETMRAGIRSDVLTIGATGYVPINHDFNTTLEADLQRAEVVSLPMALILLLIVFGTVVAALLPLGVGMLAVVGGLAATFALSHVTDVSQYALNIVTLIGLGVAIDYSLFIVNRFREELARGMTVENAVARSLSTAGRAITFSGLTVAIGLAGMLFYQGTFLASMGEAGALVVAIAVFYGLTFLPALLSLLGPRIDSWRLSELIRRIRRRPVAVARTGPGLWHALAMGVMRRPVLVLLPVLAFILIAGSPFLRLRLANGDVDMLPPTAESRVAFHRLTDDFPRQGQNDFQIVVRFTDGIDPLTAEHIDGLYDLTQRIGAIPEIVGLDAVVNGDSRATIKLTKQQYAQLFANRDQLPAQLKEGVRLSVGPNIAVITAHSNRPLPSDEAREQLKDLRALTPPPAKFGGSRPRSGWR